jgi:hypothetical protein
MLHNQDWTAVDLEALPADAIPATSYKPRGDRSKYDAAYTHWKTESEGSVAARDVYRVAWRRMAANTGERTLTPSLIPPGAAHINAVHTIGVRSGDLTALVVVAASMASLLADCVVRTAPKSEILFSVVGRLPLASQPEIVPWIALRVLRLNCLTTAHAPLWSGTFDPRFTEDSWTIRAGSGSPALGDVAPTWTDRAPLRVAADRRRALVELDALVGVAVGVTADELCTIYRTQFPVLRGYDSASYVFDGNGRMVPTAVLSQIRKAGEDLPEDHRTVTHPHSGITYVYEPPFRTLDRETDLRDAYSEFERRLAVRRENSA